MDRPAASAHGPTRMPPVLAPSAKRRPRLLLLLGAGLGSLVFASPASANLISPEAPHSPNAEDERTLYWIALIAILALIIVVNGAIVFAVRRYRSERGAEPRQVQSGGKIQARVGGALALFALILFVTGIVFTNKAREVPPSGPDGLQASATLLAQRSLEIPAGDNAPLEITAPGQQWLWRYNYPNGADSYYQLVVPVDTTVLLDLLSTDVTHSWFVPALGGKFEAVPGKRNRAFFRADETGTYFGQSATFSGSGYGAMRTEVKVVSPDEYKAFIDRQQKDIQAAQDAISALSKGGTE